MPVDFDAYSIIDKSTAQNPPAPTEPLAEKEHIWRISSLTTFVDADTKILLLPLPESKRAVKIQDTKYDFKTYGDLFDKTDKIIGKL